MPVMPVMGWDGVLLQYYHYLFSIVFIEKWINECWHETHIATACFLLPSEGSIRNIRPIRTPNSFFIDFADVHIVHGMNYGVANNA